MCVERGVGLPTCVCSRRGRHTGHHEPAVAMSQLDARGKRSGQTEEEEDACEEEGARAHHQPRNDVWS